MLFRSDVYPPMNFYSEWSSMSAKAQKAAHSLGYSEDAWVPLEGSPPGAEAAVAEHHSHHAKKKAAQDAKKAKAKAAAAKAAKIAAAEVEAQMEAEVEAQMEEEAPEVHETHKQARKKAHHEHVSVKAHEHKLHQKHEQAVHDAQEAHAQDHAEVRQRPDGAGHPLARSLACLRGSAAACVRRSCCCHCAARQWHTRVCVAATSAAQLRCLTPAAVGCCDAQLVHAEEAAAHERKEMEEKEAVSPGSAP